MPGKSTEPKSKNPMKDMTLPGWPALAAMSHLQAHALKVMLRYQIEALDFVRYRLSQDDKLIDDLVASQDTGDTFDVCSDYYQNAFIDYSREAGKVARIGSKLASEISKEIQEETRSVAEDMAARTAA